MKGGGGSGTLLFYFMDYDFAKQAF